VPLQQDMPFLAYPGDRRVRHFGRTLIGARQLQPAILRIFTASFDPNAVEKRGGRVARAKALAHSANLLAPVPWSWHHKTLLRPRADLTCEANDNGRVVGRRVASVVVGSMSELFPDESSIATAEARTAELTRGECRTPQTTIEAIMRTVRVRGVVALTEPANIERLSRCNPAARAEINERIKRLIEAKEIVA